MTSYKAVIFDIGGVCVGSPFNGIAEYEKEHHLPPNFINVSMQVERIARSGENGAFQRLERGEISLQEFYKIFGKELSDPKNKEYYLEYTRLREGSTAINESHLPATTTIDGRELLIKMISEFTVIDPVVFEALKSLRASKKYKIVALTNNFQVSPDDSQEIEILGDAHTELKNLFDEYFESSIIGLRKPDPKIFTYACSKLNIEPKDAIFLDDIGMNLKAAKELGMTTIKVELGNSEKAIKELENLLGISLLNNTATNVKLSKI
ncbi:8228_t:CDS:2 [Acaulospora morrowiae]|uniref:8228_t:CDS:1 n=1 Tax=Acaulospora morrowiae TaxID=94023 RepID=A0A9N9NIH5_9GLOM|nr:8228_t:CDS:2 [Acaulospora morrowiae]